MKGIIGAALVAIVCAASACLATLDDDVPSEIAARASELSAGKSMQSAMESHATELAKALAAQKLTGEQTLETAQAIMAKLNKLEASLAKSEPQNGKDGDPAPAPEFPAKANTQQAPLKVATPGTSFRTTSDGTVLRWNIAGNWNPTILETSAHLRAEHGIDTNGMTHQEMADIHAALHEGKPMPVRSTPVQSFVTRSSCPGGVCPVPQRVSRKRR